MVEIVLALSVLSIAIVSLMGLLPVALRASKNSVAENSVAAVVDVIKMRVDQTYAASADLNAFQSSLVEVDDDFFPDITDSTKLAFDDSNTKFPANAADLEKYAFRITDGNTSGTYKVEFFSGIFDSGEFTTTDFDADVRVCYDKLDGSIYIPINNEYNFTNKIFEKGSAVEVPLNVACSVYIEVSWPAETAYANQEHRLYKFDYFAK